MSEMDNEAKRLVFNAELQDLFGEAEAIPSSPEGSLERYDLWRIVEAKFAYLHDLYPMPDSVPES